MDEQMDHILKLFIAGYEVFHQVHILFTLTTEVSNQRFSGYNKPRVINLSESQVLSIQGNNWISVTDVASLSVTWLNSIINHLFWLGTIKINQRTILHRRTALYKQKRIKIYALDISVDTRNSKEWYW